MGYYAEKIRKQGFKEGKEKGYINAQTTLITSILNNGYTPEEVSKMTNVNINDINKIIENNKK